MNFTKNEDDDDDGDADYNEDDDIDYYGEKKKKGRQRKYQRLPNGRLQCEMCDKTLADPKTLTMHMRLHTGKGLKRCHICGRGFPKLNHLKRHLQNHMQQDFVCNYCPQSFESRPERRAHAKT